MERSQRQATRGCYSEVQPRGEMSDCKETGIENEKMKMEERVESSPRRQGRGPCRGEMEDNRWSSHPENLSASRRTGVMGRDAIAESTTRLLHSAGVSTQSKGFSNPEINKTPKNILIES